MTPPAAADTAPGTADPAPFPCPGPVADDYLRAADALAALPRSQVRTDALYDALPALARRLRAASAHPLSEESQRLLRAMRLGVLRLPPVSFTSRGPAK